MTTSSFDLSIVIPSYNRDDLIRRTLLRLFESDCTGLNEIEVVIVDDGSPKPVQPLVDELTPPASFRRKVIRTPNRGIGASRNLGYAEAMADLVVFLDDDVLVQPDTLRKFVAAHRDEPCGVIFGIYPFASHESESLRRFANLLYDYHLIDASPRFVYVEEIVSGLLSVRKSAIKTDKLYRDDLRIPAAEEHELIYRFNREGRKIAHARHIHGVHDHHLDLEWMANQQYKYGMAAAEAFEKYPQILEMSKFAEMRSALDAGGVAGRLKDLASSRRGRSILITLARLLQRSAPNADHNRAYGLMTAAYMRGGYNDHLAEIRS